MWRRVCALVVLAGCWSDDPPVNGFTADQWAALQHELTVPTINPCALPSGTVPVARCDQLAGFGQQLFFDPGLSDNGLVSCGTCHDPTKYFIDSRAQNNVSFGVPEAMKSSWTKRNAMATVDLALKYNLETTKRFIWTGKAKTPGAVLEVAVGGPPFETTLGHVSSVVMSKYGATYSALFPSTMPTTEEIIANIETALDAYMFQITSLDSPFDAWLAGNEDAIPDSAKRGFVVFVGRGTCITCHSGPAFSDFAFHDTGVPQTGPNTQFPDLGLADITMLVDDEGKFMTPTLRNIARTGPYMHDGVFQSLPEVVEFYRRGGGDGMYSGVKDPKITPLDLSDDDVRDLVAFLESLNGTTLSQYGMGSGSGSGSGSGAGCGTFTNCNGTCTNTLSDVDNCGGCGITCQTGESCVMGRCGPSVCMMPPLTQCATGCTNLQIDFNHCGDCGHMCGPMQACVMGTCIAAPLCPPMMAPCGQACFDFENDKYNCGGCGFVCAGSCMDGLCV